MDRTLDANLAMLERMSPQTAAEIRQWTHTTPVEVRDESEWADSVDIQNNAVAIVPGIGPHVAALAKRMRYYGTVIVYEPDLSRLRGYFGAADRMWLASANVAVLTEPGAAAFATVIQNNETWAMLGTTIAVHPPSLSRLPGFAGFVECAANVWEAVCTQVITALNGSEQFFLNAVMNADHYAASRGIADLAGIYAPPREPVARAERVASGAIMTEPGAFPGSSFVSVRPSDIAALAHEWEANPGQPAVDYSRDGDKMTQAWTWTGGDVAALSDDTYLRFAMLKSMHLCPFRWSEAVFDDARKCWFIRRVVNDDDRDEAAGIAATVPVQEPA